MFVIRFPTQSAQFGVLLETYRKGGDIDHLALCFFRIIVGDRQNNIFLKNADFNISAICFSYSFGTPDYPGCVYPASHHMGGVLCDEFGYG